MNKIDVLLNITNRNAKIFNQFFTPICFYCDGCSCLSLIRTSNCGFVFDRATRMSSFTFNRFRLLVLIATKDENPDSHKYVVAKGIIATMACFTKRGYACPNEIQKSPILFELKDIPVSLPSIQ